MGFYRGTALDRVYDDAKDGGYGFVASNVTHPDIMVGLLNGAVAAGSDVVLQLKRDTAEYVGNGDVAAGVHAMGEHVRALAANLDVGVFLNIDHIRHDDDEFLETCIDSGLPSSVMVDASTEPFEKNVERTRHAVELIDDCGEDVLVEAELGKIKGVEGGVETTDAFYTDPDEAVEFVDRTGCDLLAISIGTQHGVSKGKELDLRIDLAREINETLLDHGIDIPLVVHGSSGLYPAQVRELLATGVCKLNTNTRYQYEYARTALEFYREHESSVRPPEDVEDDRDGFFSDADWSPVKADFNPQVVGRHIRERIATVMADLADLSGSAGESRYVTP